MLTSRYRVFFDDAYLRYADARLSAEQTRLEVDFIAARLALPPGASILDLCCGHGRHAVELARRGYRVTGLDQSEVALARAAKAANQAGVMVSWVRADMRAIPFPEHFDACVNWFTSFGYLEEDEEHHHALTAVRQAIKPGGKLILDLLNEPWFHRNFSPRTWLEGPDGELFLEETRFDPRAGCIRFRTTAISPGGERSSADLDIRLFTFVELVQLLKRAHFRYTNAWGNTDASPLSMFTPRMIVLAEKADDPSVGVNQED